jgi:hypothetical protein
VKEKLRRAAQALEADAAVGASPAAEAGEGAAAAGAGAGGAHAGKAQARAKKADEYHARHAAWVAEFNALTGGDCAGGAGGVKWAAVRAWQQKHWQLNNLLADGLLNDQGIASARWAELRQRAIVALDAYYQLATERDAYAAQKQLEAAGK